MYAISKQFHFSASHVLKGLPDAHPCARLHGHNYEVIIRLEANVLDKIGMVLDYGRLACVKQWIDDTLDHRHLNDILPHNPTAEVLARTIHAQTLVLLGEEIEARSIYLAVRVSETPATWAEYE